MTRTSALTAIVACAAVLTACSSSDTACSSLTGCESADSDPEPSDTLSIAAVNNGDFTRLQELSQAFLEEHPGIKIEWIIEGENEIRETISTDVGTGAGRFDVVTVGTYETPLWAEREWLLPMTEMPSGFDVDGFIPSIRQSLSFEGEMYAAPFYGESSFTMYRTDLFEQAGVTMPDRPTWSDIIDRAATVSESTDVDGVCLRGKAGWGENMALMTAMANSYGARWFDEEWVPQLDSAEWADATENYLELAEYAPSDVASNGFQENLALFQEGECAMWVDATSAASFVTDPEASSVADDVGFAYAPGTGLDKQSNWLWSWALAIPETSTNEELAKEFISWATSSEYADLVASEYGWANVPPGARTALYENQDYLDAAPFAELSLESIEDADAQQPTVQPVPYEGVQYVDIAAFQSIGTAVGNQLSDAVAGEVGADEALENSQWVTERVIEQSRAVEDTDDGN
ncbi:MAG: sugar ABC transporter substrate-binding protein [Ornithinimicrobium sp.]